MAPDRALPLGLIVAIVVAYIVPGLIGHDPWKQDEAYVFGGILDMLKDGDWAVVKVGGIPFVEKPPLYHWLGVAMTKIFSPWLALHDAARLASGVFVAMMAAACAWASHLLWGPGRGRVGALMALSAAGLLTNAQLMITDLPQMAGFALAIAGFAASHKARRWAGLVIGAGAGVGFLGKGVLAPAVIGCCALVLPLAFAQWRTRRYLRDLAWAFACAIPFVTVWPAALWMHSPALFREWLWDNNVGRFLGFSVPYLGAATERGFWLETWPWFLFPLWIFVARAILRDRRAFAKCAGAQIGLTMAACIAIVLATSASARAIYALPMIPPLALVAARPAPHGDMFTDGVLYVLGMGFAFAVAAVVWCGWASLVFTGHSPEWPWLTYYFPAAFALEFDADNVVMAATMTVGYAVACVVLRRSVHRGLAAWVGSLALGWALVALLWFPWVDYAKSYRSVYESVARALPPGVDCVASLGIGESERAMLEYVLGIRTIPLQAGCHAILRERPAYRFAGRLPAPWRLQWFGSRPGDYGERFELWVR